jgi:hypothetical protein
MTARPTAARRYLLFAAAAAGATVLLVAVGWLPIGRLAGAAGVAAMLAACAIGLVGSLLGGLPIALAERTDREAPAGRPAAPPVFRAMAGTGLRFAVVVVLVAAAGLSGRLPLRPLLVWTAISYLALLAVDTRYAVAAASASSRAGGGRGRRDDSKTSEEPES